MSFRLASLLGISLLSKLAYAAGETPPAGLQGLAEILLQITLYPYIGVALAFLVYKATNKAWAFVLIPFFYWGLSYLVPIIPPLEPVPGDSLVLYSSVLTWLYLPPVLATAIGYRIYWRTKRLWIFVLVPVLGWILQVLSFAFIVELAN